MGHGQESIRETKKNDPSKAMHTYENLTNNAQKNIIDEAGTHKVTWNRPQHDHDDHQHRKWKTKHNNKEVETE